MKRILHVVGARPNFMKAAPVMTALGAIGGLDQRLVHAGQPYDDSMAGVQFANLGLPRPDRNLNVGEGGEAGQVHDIEARFAEALGAERPDMVVVYGDVNSTVAAARVAARSGVPVAHVAAGLRSFDLSMPEEINRIETDRVSSLLLTSSREADENLKREGVNGRIHFVGNHRPANVDDAAAFAQILSCLEPLTGELPIIFPVHPRTRHRLSQNGVADLAGHFRTTDPLGYLEFLALMDHAACVLTDSGGIQEETTVLGVPCFTLRDNTERPVTIDHGTNTLVGANASALPAAFKDFQRTGGKQGRIPEGWDGAAAGRIARILAEFLS